MMRLAIVKYFLFNFFSSKLLMNIDLRALAALAKLLSLVLLLQRTISLPNRQNEET